MRRLIPHIFALVLTTLILNFIPYFVGGMVSPERRREVTIEKYELKPILDAIDESGVDKEKLANVLQEELGLVWQLSATLVGIAFIVWVYSLVLRWGRRLFSKTIGHPPREVSTQDDNEAQILSGVNEPNEGSQRL